VVCPLLFATMRLLRAAEARSAEASAPLAG